MLQHNEQNSNDGGKAAADGTRIAASIFLTASTAVLAARKASTTKGNCNISSNVAASSRTIANHHSSVRGQIFCSQETKDSSGRRQDHQTKEDRFMTKLFL